MMKRLLPMEIWLPWLRRSIELPPGWPQGA